jgi:hypothetical protein
MCPHCGKMPSRVDYPAHVQGHIADGTYRCDWLIPEPNWRRCVRFARLLVRDGHFCKQHAKMMEG